MRQVVLDTETTGLEPEQGHRVIEIGCVELVNRRLTKRNFHCYLQPDRAIDEGALAVHGITQEFLEGKPRFADVAEDLVDFLRGAELVIHNAAFDVAFIDAELSRLPERVEVHEFCTVLDTLSLARRLHPGQRNSLDALCKRYEIDNSQRQLHGALLDAEILADVYLAMTGGQTAWDFETLAPTALPGESEARSGRRRAGTLKVLRATEQERAAHEARLDALEAESGACVWRSISQ